MIVAAEALRRRGSSEGLGDALRHPAGSRVGTVGLKESSGRAKPAGCSANQRLKRYGPCADRAAIREDGRPVPGRRDTNHRPNRRFPSAVGPNRLIGIVFLGFQDVWRRKRCPAKVPSSPERCLGRSICSHIGRRPVPSAGVRDARTALGSDPRRFSDRGYCRDRLGPRPGTRPQRPVRSDDLGHSTPAVPVAAETQQWACASRGGPDSHRRTPTTRQAIAGPSRPAPTRSRHIMRTRTPDAPPTVSGSRLVGDDGIEPPTSSV